MDSDKIENIHKACLITTTRDEFNIAIKTPVTIQLQVFLAIVIKSFPTVVKDLANEQFVIM